MLLEPTCQKRQPLTKFLFNWCALCGPCLPVPASLTSFWQLLSMGASYKEYALVQVFEEQFYSSLSRLDNIESILWKFATFNQCCYFLPDSFLNPFLSFQFKRPSRRYPILVWHFFFFTIFVCPVILIYCQSLCVLYWYEPCIYLTYLENMIFLGRQYNLVCVEILD